MRMRYRQHRTRREGLAGGERGGVRGRGKETSARALTWPSCPSATSAYRKATESVSAGCTAGHGEPRRGRASETHLPLCERLLVRLRVLERRVALLELGELGVHVLLEVREEGVRSCCERLESERGGRERGRTALYDDDLPLRVL